MPILFPCTNYILIIQLHVRVSNKHTCIVIMFKRALLHSIDPQTECPDETLDKRAMVGK